MSNVVLPTTWQYGARTGGWCPSPLRAHGLVGEQGICISIFSREEVDFERVGELI